MVKVPPTCAQLEADAVRVFDFVTETLATQNNEVEQEAADILLKIQLTIDARRESLSTDFLSTDAELTLRTMISEFWDWANRVIAEDCTS